MFMKNLKPLAAGLIAAGCWLASSTVHAQVVNGSLTGPIANTSVPDGWININNTADTMDANNNVGVAGLADFSATPSASPDGGTWVGVGADSAYIETFGQHLTGLTVGQTYSVSWHDANFGVESLGYNNPNSFKALIDGTSIGSGGIRSVGTSWYDESVSFTATASTATLAFELASDAKSYLSIDGISIATTVNPIPEPETWALMLAGLGFVARRANARRSKQAAAISN
ncbi:MAG: PEP-CTERM sorting domain-containing protein [Pseudomonadota bacterium]